MCLQQIVSKVSLGSNWRISYYVEFAAAVMNGHVTPFAIIFAIGKKLIHEV